MFRLRFVSETGANEREYMAARVFLLSILFTEVLKPACAAGASFTVAISSVCLHSSMSHGNSQIAEILVIACHVL